MQVQKAAEAEGIPYYEVSALTGAGFTFSQSLVEKAASQFKD
jgi:hypothetical protein